MQNNSTKLQTILDIQHLVFIEEARRPRLIRLRDSIGRNKINDLKIAIYQIEEDDPGLKAIKAQTLSFNLYIMFLIRI